MDPDDRQRIEERLMRLEKQLGVLRTRELEQHLDHEEARRRLRLLELHLEAKKGKR